MDLNRQMVNLARELEHESGRQSTLDLLVESTRDLIESCSDSNVMTLRRDARRVEVITEAASSPRARTGDDWQREMDEGPCLQAVWDDPLVHSYDLAEDARWPRWAPRVVRELGIRSMLCVRLWTRDNDLGALNLYSERVGGFVHDEREQALSIAAHAAVAMSALDHVDQLHQGLARRTVIGQATGIIMERFGLESATAFEVLRRTSQQHNRKVHDIAEEVVDPRRRDVLPRASATEDGPGGST